MNGSDNDSLVPLLTRNQRTAAARNDDEAREPLLDLTHAKYLKVFVRRNIFDDPGHAAIAIINPDNTIHKYFSIAQCPHIGGSAAQNALRNTAPLFFRGASIEIHRERSSATQGGNYPIRDQTDSSEYARNADMSEISIRGLSAQHIESVSDTINKLIYLIESRALRYGFGKNCITCSSAIDLCLRVATFHERNPLRQIDYFDHALMIMARPSFITTLSSPSYYHYLHEHTQSSTQALKYTLLLSVLNFVLTFIVDRVLYNLIGAIDISKAQPVNTSDSDVESDQDNNNDDDIQDDQVSDNNDTDIMHDDKICRGIFLTKYFKSHFVIEQSWQDRFAGFLINILTTILCVLHYSQYSSIEEETKSTFEYMQELAMVAFYLLVCVAIGYSYMKTSKYCCSSNTSSEDLMQILNDVRRPDGTLERNANNKSVVERLNPHIVRCTTPRMVYENIFCFRNIQSLLNQSNIIQKDIITKERHLLWIFASSLILLSLSYSAIASVGQYYLWASLYFLLGAAISKMFIEIDNLMSRITCDIIPRIDYTNERLEVGTRKLYRPRPIFFSMTCWSSMLFISLLIRSQKNPLKATFFGSTGGIIGQTLTLAAFYLFEIIRDRLTIRCNGNNTAPTHFASAVEENAFGIELQQMPFR